MRCLKTKILQIFKKGECVSIPAWLHATDLFRACWIFLLDVRNSANHLPGRHSHPDIGWVWSELLESPPLIPKKRISLLFIICGPTQIAAGADSWRWQPWAASVSSLCLRGPILWAMPSAAADALEAWIPGITRLKAARHLLGLASHEGWLGWVQDLSSPVSFRYRFWRGFVASFDGLCVWLHQWNSHFIKSALHHTAPVRVSAGTWEGQRPE